MLKRLKKKREPSPYEQLRGSILANEPLDKVANYSESTDDTPPSITLNSPENGSTLQSGTVIDLTITGSNGSLIYNWDGNTNQTVTSITDPILPSGDGTHTLYCYAKDDVENWISSQFEFMTDDTPPLIVLISPTNGSIQASGTTIDLTVSGSNGSLIYNWDGGSNQTVTASTDPSLPSGEGLHRLYCYAKDIAGNWIHVYFEFQSTVLLPSIVLISPMNRSTQQSGTTILVIVSNSNGSLIYHWDDGSNQTVPSTTNLILPSGEGPHYL